MLQLNNLDSLGKKRKRVGRGGSRGGTSGRGHKGQKSRSGTKFGLVFEGGQMPLPRRLPKRGFTNARFKKVCAIVNLSDLERAFENEAVITKDVLAKKGLLSVKKSGGACLLKILGKGDVTKKFTVHADLFSVSARTAIERAGGQVKETT